MVVTISRTAPHAMSFSAQQPTITHRGRVMLVLMARGASSASIRGGLFISSHTVDTRLKHIFDRLGVRSRAAAVSQGVRLAQIHVD